MYIIPSVIVIAFIINVMLNNADILFLIEEIELLIISVFLLIVGVGLYKANRIAWWCASIWPIFLVAYGAFYYLYSLYILTNVESKSVVVSLMVSGWIFCIGIYYMVINVIIHKTDIKKYFNIL